MITRREAAIIGAYTGILMGDIADFQSYAEEVAERPVDHLDMADRVFIDNLKILSRPDFLRLITTVEGFEMTDQYLQILEDEGVEL